MSYVQPWFFDQIQDLKADWNYDEALKRVNSILCNDPNNKDALFEIADILYLKWDISSAEKPIDFMLNKKWDDPMGFYVKGVLEMEKTNWNIAKKFFKKAVSMSSEDNPEILRCYWLCEYWLGNREKGMDFLNSAFNASEQLDAEIIYNLVEINLLEHNYESVSYYIDFYNKNRDKLNCFEKDISFYDEKISLFKNYLNII